MAEQTIYNYGMVLSEDEFKLHIMALDSYARKICEKITTSQNAALDLKNFLHILIQINAQFIKLDGIYDDNKKEVVKDGPVKTSV